MSEDQFFALLLRRMDQQDAAADRLEKMVQDHVIKSEDIAKDLEELVTIWRARKILGVVLGGVAAVAAAGWNLIAWAKDHIR